MAPTGNEYVQLPAPTVEPRAKKVINLKIVQPSAHKDKTPTVGGAAEGVDKAVAGTEEEHVGETAKEAEETPTAMAAAITPLTVQPAPATPRQVATAVQLPRVTPHHHSHLNNHLPPTHIRPTELGRKRNIFPSSLLHGR